MIKYNTNTINDWNFDASNIVKVYHNGAVCYYKLEGSPTPTAQTPCYAVVQDITQYSDTEFVDVFNKADGKWYKLNNLNQYEKYGIYGDGRNITYYEGKLTIDSGYEYEYSNGAWVNLGETSVSTRLPQGYTEVEYLETPKKTEYPYIDTGFKPNQNTRAIADFQYTQNNTHPRCFGCGMWNSNGYILNAENGVGTSSGVWKWKFGQTSAWLTTGVKTDFNRHTAEINNGKLYLDDVQIGSTTVTTFQLSDNIGLFGFINGGTLYGTSSGEYMTGKFYSFKIYDNETLVRDFVPCKRDSDSKYGMYDIVGGSFYISPNSYLFTGGSATTHIVYPLYYEEKQDPPLELEFDNMAEALAYECPYVGVVAYIDGELYEFNDEYKWEKLSFTITGVTTSSNAFDIKLNMQSESVTVYNDNGDGTYNWGIYYPNEITNATNMCSGNTTLKTFDWGTANTADLTGLTSSFRECSGLTTMPSIPSNVTEIGNYAFYNCRNMNNGGVIEIPEGVTTLGTYSFGNVFHSNIKNIKIPSTLTSINSNAFYNKSNTHNLYISDLSKYCKINFSSTSSTIFNGASTYLYVNNSMVQNVTIPSDVTALSSYTFYKAAHITGVTIPSSVTNIGGWNTFQYSGLKNVTVPSSVTSWTGYYTFAYCKSLTAATLNNTGDISSSSFQGCTSLTNITLGNNVTRIGSSSFQGCTALKTLTIPSNITSIYSYAFNGCTSLETVSFEATTPPSIESTAFKNVPSTCIFYVPCSAVNTYRTASNWSNYASQIVGFESCTTYDWQVVSGEYICYQHDKYEKLKKICSFDGGTTWEDFTPIQYQRGELIEESSEDCPIILPDGYDEVEYIQNTGTSYLDIAFKPNTNTRILTEMQAVSTSNYPRLFGAGIWSAADGINLAYQSDGGSNCLHINWYGITSWSYYTSFTFDYDKHTYDLNKNSLYRDETLVGSTSYTTSYQSTDNLGIFTYMSGGRPSNSVYWGQEHFKGKMYSFKVYDNETLVIDLVPCVRTSDNTVGAYDIVNDVFYTVPTGYTTDTLVAGQTV